MKKIRVLFPYIEAGFGHIMPMQAIDQKFREKYGDRVEVISSRFLSETGDKHMKRYERMISNQVRTYNRCPPIGYFATFMCEVWGSTLSSLGAIRLIAPIAFKHSVEHMRELSPNLVFSTHWASNYYAEHLKDDKPITVMYCPDAELNKLFEYHADLNMISMPYGYEQALRKRKYTTQNMRLVPFLIRNAAFEITDDKRQLRRKLGLPEDNFTVLLAEGGYGIGKMAELTELLLKEHLPLTVIPVCGTNKALYEKLKKLPSSREVTYRPYAFADNMLELQAAADIFCGKSGNILAEPTFFGNPSIITHFANLIEKKIGRHYLRVVGSAIKEFSVEKAVALIRSFAKDRSLMEPYRRAARAYHENFGAEKAADLLWELLVQRYPELNEQP